ncbi:MAG: hypothetical protein ACLUD0_05675 [Eubacterium ramulus]
MTRFGLLQNYAVNSVNSMLASIESGSWNFLDVGNLKVKRNKSAEADLFVQDEKELTEKGCEEVDCSRL